MMQPTTIPKDKVLGKLRENRAKHRAVFDEAMKGYRTEAEAVLRAKLDEVEHGRLPKQIYLSLNRPEDHTRDYDRLIEMIELDEGDTWIMNERDFALFMRDEWDWKRAWLKMSDRYAAGSTRAAYAADFAEMEADE